MSLIAELKRRNVFRVAAAYAIVAWLLVEVASVVLPTFGAPEWVMKVVTFLVILGFPLAVILAWAFELTPDGVKREKDVDRSQSITHQTGRKLDFIIIGVLAVGIIYFAADKFRLQSAPEPTEVVDEAVQAVESTAQVKTIAVLPFVNMSDDPEQGFFSDGITEELLNVLAKVKGLRVTSRTSAFSFKGTNTSIPEIAQKLGVQHVLEGSVRMAGDRVRITAQLIEVETDSHLWSESYDRELSDIFAVQDEIAKKVGEALKLALLGADFRPIRTGRETSIEIYSDYLLARQKMASATIAALGEAERLLKAVIERDPNYAPAYAALSSTYRSMALFQSIPLSEAFARMTPLVEQALHLDGDLGEAWQNLAYVRLANRDLEGARAARERALKLNPQDLYVLEGQITYWIYTHEPERGLGFAEEMLRVDPLSPSSLQWAGTLYRQIGRLDDAKEMLERTRSINPPNAVYFYNASIYALYDGDLATAITSMERYLTLDPVDSEVTATVALTYFELGDVAGAEFWKESALRRDPGSSGARLTAAFLHLYHNEEAEAVAIARELVQPGLRTWGNPKAVALRIVAASDLAAGRYQQTIARYVTHYPELADGEFPIGTAALKFGPTGEIFSATLGLAATYLRAGENEKADSLLSLVESELPHWPADMAWGHGFADVELHALRGEKERALVALRGHTARRTTQWWRWYLLHDPNLESLHDEPEFQAMVAEIESDMAVQLARVREMERNGELEPIPEVSATAQ